MGLGSTELVSLAEAREAALAARKQVRVGEDPIEAKRGISAAQRLEQARAVTFKNAAEQYIKAHRASWRNERHAAQWNSTLAAYAYPVFGDLAVQAVDVALVRKVLDPIWTTTTETASRLRGRIETILDWATVAGYRHGDNPARWRGHLDKMLPKRTRVQRVKHFNALAYRDIGAFMNSLQEEQGLGALALRFTILTAARTGEVLGARWQEIDFANAIWTVPADRMKAGKEHRAPLSRQALTLLRERHEATGGEGYVFPGSAGKRPLSHVVMLKVIARMGRSDLTVHGFRSTFRDWAAEQTAYPREVAELALGHAVGDKVEAAYRRSDLLEKRRALAQAWANFCMAKPASRAKIVPINAAKVAQ